MRKKMDKFKINGPCRLKGEVKISGSKNAALPILISTLLTDETCTISDVPDLRDVKTTIKLLRYLGKRVNFENNSVRIEKNSKLKTKAPYNLVKQMRASFLVAGPLLARFKKASVPLPGGCAIGLRPVDLHLKGFASMGAKITTEKGDILVNSRKLKNTHIKLDYPSVGATENLVLCAVKVPGKTVISNFAKEPEVIDLINFLNSIGAEICVNEKSLTIKGVKKLGGANYKIIPDRIEAGTYIIAGCATNGKITLENSNPLHLKALINAIRKTQITIKTNKDSITILPISKKPRSIDIKTGVYPAFPTDLLPLWTVLMCKAKKQAKISETIFENRFMHIPELARMGALIAVNGHTAMVDCSSDLVGAKVMASDLRGGASLVIAGLTAKGETLVDRAYHIDRGYENIEKKLTALGADIKRIG